MVWIIDREQWPRAYLRAELIERGFDVVAFPSLVPALTQIRQSPGRKPSALVLELREQKMTPRSVARMACTKVPIVAVGGAVEMNHPLVREFEWAELLRRPVTIGAVADAVGKCIRQGSTSSEKN